MLLHVSSLSLMVARLQRGRVDLPALYCPMHPQVNAALAQPHSETLQFVLGTEAGMITAIVRKVQGLLSKAGRDDVAVEVVFPVMPSAISTPEQQTSSSAQLSLPAGERLIPVCSACLSSLAPGSCVSSTVAMHRFAQMHGCQHDLLQHSKGHVAMSFSKCFTCLYSSTHAQPQLMVHSVQRAVPCRPRPGAGPRRRRGLLAGGRLRQLPLHEDEHAGSAAGCVREGRHACWGGHARGAPHAARAVHAVRAVCAVCRFQNSLGLSGWSDDLAWHM